MTEIFRTNRGILYCADSYSFLSSHLSEYRNKINLIFTSPPFPLNRRKAYGNLTGTEYIDWLANYADLFREILAPDGSLVMELGNAWERGTPTMSTLSIEALLELKKRGNFYLCQEFIWNNPARLPSPVQWVNVERIRIKDAFTRLWWLSTTVKPKADNRRVLRAYSVDMKGLLRRRKYNAGKRPSEHVIGSKSFLKDNGGSIPSNVLSISNTSSKCSYLEYCKKQGIVSHPARMPSELAAFFIRFLTDKNDYVLDPFAGSNTTGWVAEKLRRNWISIEVKEEYAQASKSRFLKQHHSSRIG